MNKYDCFTCAGFGKIKINSPEGDYATSCVECGGSGKRKIRIDLEEYDRLKALDESLYVKALVRLTGSGREKEA